MTLNFCQKWTRVKFEILFFHVFSCFWSHFWFAPGLTKAFFKKVVFFWKWVFSKKSPKTLWTLACFLHSLSFWEKVLKCTKPNISVSEMHTFAIWCFEKKACAQKSTIFLRFFTALLWANFESSKKGQKRGFFERAKCVWGQVEALRPQTFFGHFGILVKNGPPDHKQAEKESPEQNWQIGKSVWPLFERFFHFGGPWDAKSTKKWEKMSKFDQKKSIFHSHAVWAKKVIFDHFWDCFFSFCEN